MILKGNITRRKDLNAIEYFGITINRNDVQCFLLELENVVGKEKYRNITNAKKLRDGDEYHLTVFSPNELEAARDICSTKEYRFDLLGIGSVNDSAYYIVVESKELTKLREMIGLKEMDFHITLGFKDKDIHGVCKNKDTLIGNQRN